MSPRRCRITGESQSLHIPHGGLSKESLVFAIELACALVADLERSTCSIQFTGKHLLPCGIETKLFLELKWAHRSHGSKMVVQRRSAHARNRCQVFHSQRFLVMSTQPRNCLRRPMALVAQSGDCPEEPPCAP